MMLVDELYILTSGEEVAQKGSDHGPSEYKLGATAV
jgi:hypothetical protein